MFIHQSLPEENKEVRVIDPNGYLFNARREGRFWHQKNGAYLSPYLSLVDDDQWEYV